MQRPSRVQTAVVGDTDYYSEFMSQKKTLSKFLNTAGENQRFDAMHFNKVYWTKDQFQGREDPSSEGILGILWDAWWRHAQKMKMYRAIEHFGKKGWGKMCHWEIYGGPLI